MDIIPIVQPTLYDFEEVVAEFRQAWETGQVTSGKFVRRFEEAVEHKLEVSHAVMVQSCTAGMMLLWRAWELKGEVVLPAFTWTATAHAALWAGLTPVFADIAPGAYTLDHRAAAQAITPRTVALMPVNIFGCPPDYPAFARLARERGLHLFYDSAQGLGSRFQGPDQIWQYAGGFGEAEVFSMSPTKVVSAMEGGLITTSNEDLARQLRQMRDYGKSPDGEDVNWLGLSARPQEINAIVARHNFSHMDELVARRGELMDLYKELLGDLEGVSFQEIPPNCRSSWNYCAIFLDPEAGRSRDQVYNSLKEQGIQAKKYFYPALHLQKVYQSFRATYEGKLPVTEAAAARGLALPLFTHMSPDFIRQVCDRLLDILK